MPNVAGWLRPGRAQRFKQIMDWWNERIVPLGCAPCEQLTLERKKALNNRCYGRHLEVDEEGQRHWVVIDLCDNLDLLYHGMQALASTGFCPDFQWVFQKAKGENLMSVRERGLAVMSDMKKDADRAEERRKEWEL